MVLGNACIYSAQTCNSWHKASSIKVLFSFVTIAVIRIIKDAFKVIATIVKYAGKSIYTAMGSACFEFQIM